MRITNSMLSNTLLSSVSSTSSKIYTLSNQVSTNKRILKSSDDPTGTAQALGLRASLASLEQYGKNVNAGKAELAQVDSALSSISTALTSAKTSALSGATATSDASKRQNLAEQIQQNIDTILQQINTTYLNRHIFGGNQTQDTPVTADAGGAYVYNGDSGTTNVQVSDGTAIGISVTAADVLNMNGAVDASAPDALSVLVSLKKDLTSGDLTSIQDHIAQLDTLSQNVVDQRAKMGTRKSQLSVYATRITDTTTSLTERLSSVEEVDITSAITQLQAEQNVYQASLYAMASMSRKNLGDYLS